MDPEHAVTLTFFFSRLYPLTHWIEFFDTKEIYISP